MNIAPSSNLLARSIRLYFDLVVPNPQFFFGVAASDSTLSRLILNYSIGKGINSDVVLEAAACPNSRTPFVVLASHVARCAREQVSVVMFRGGSFCRFASQHPRILVGDVGSVAGG